MSYFVKLFYFESSRFFKPFLFITLAAIAIQYITFFLDTNQYYRESLQFMKQTGESEAMFLQSNDAYSLTIFMFSTGFTSSILICACLIAFYIFYIWYRDWLGKSSFIYRLLQVPTNRMNIYFAKLATIVFYTLVLATIQLFVLFSMTKILPTVLPESLIGVNNIAQLYNATLFNEILPFTFQQFLLTYVTGIIVIGMIFTAILFERSYHLKGIFIAIGFVTLSVIVLLLPNIITAFTNYFYTYEILWIRIATLVIVALSSLLLAKLLIVRKIEM